MNKQEWYDPNDQHASLHYYSSIEERESYQNSAFKEKLQLNEKRAKRSRRIIFADIILLSLLILFFAFARPYLLSTKRISGIRLHGSLLHHDIQSQKIWCFLKVKNLSFSVDEKSQEQADGLTLKVTYGTQSIEKSLPIPSLGEIQGIDFGFDYQKEPSYFYVTAECKREDKPFVTTLQIPVQKYTFLF